MRIINEIKTLVISILLWFPFTIVNIIVLLLSIPKGILDITIKMLSYLPIAVEQVVYNNKRDVKR